MSNIEWTEETWNPIVGCSVVSPGCTNCYAMRMAARLEAMNVPHYAGTTQPAKAGHVWTGKLALAPDKTLTAPLRRRKPTTYFVNSMGDLFHEDCPDEWILQVLDVIRRASYDGGSNIGRIGNGESEHTFQCLTKRSARMRDFMRRLRWDCERLHLLAKDDGKASVVLKNLWLGVSIEDQDRAEERIPDLLATPAAIRFVSAEPLLGPINLRCIVFPGGEHDALGRLTHFDGGTSAGANYGIDWVIVGGESGPSARPMNPEWARDLREQCKFTSGAFFMKQMDKKTPIPDDLMIRQWPQFSEAA